MPPQLLDTAAQGTLRLGTFADATHAWIDEQTRESGCSCGAPQPCPHVRALQPRDPTRFLLSERDDGRLALSISGVPTEAAEALRWVWWTRAPEGLVGEARTLPQAIQLLAQHGYHVEGEARDSSLKGARAVFHQRVLGERIHVKIDAPTSDAGLALAQTLAARDAIAQPPDLWVLPQGAGFASWLLQAWARGAEIAPDLTLNPKPLKGAEAQIDPGCLPARVKTESVDARAAIAAILGAAPQESDGQMLVPVARIVDVEEGLRALGCDVCYHRLAPAGQRFLEWREQTEDDRTGARPRLREPWHGALAATPPGLKATTKLAGYQEEAVAFILHHAHTCLLADDMGLGKTLEAIAAAQFLSGRVLVVCPASAREVWKREVGKFTQERAEIVLRDDDAPTPQAIDEPPPKYVVTGYSNLEHVAIDAAQFDLVILDESHYVKNAAAGRAKLAREKLLGIPRRLVISGTPVMNTPDEVRAQLAFLHPDEWSDGAWFKRRFEEPFEEGTPDVRAAVLSRLRQFLEGVMIRREKSTALPDLPAKRIEWHRVQMPLEARRAYAALEAEFEQAARSEGAGFLSSAKAGGKIERLKQAALAGKMPEVVAFARGLLDAGEKVVLFSRYRAALTSLEKELASFGPVTLTGDTDPHERAEAERRFQEDAACRVFLGQLIAAGTAITLTAGTHAVFLDLDWNPANHRQAMDRIHRRGQTKPVFAHFFLAEGTVDDDVAAVLDAKGEMMDALLAPDAGAHAEIKGARRMVGERLLKRLAAPT